MQRLEVDFNWKVQTEKRIITDINQNSLFRHTSAYFYQQTHLNFTTCVGTFPQSPKPHHPHLLPNPSSTFYN